MRLLGAVRAGGRSSRFGSDKAIAMLAGRSLLDRAFDPLSALVDRIVVVGRKHAILPSLADQPQAGLGPLGGLGAALAYAEREHFDAVLTVPATRPR